MKFSSIFNVFSRRDKKVEPFSYQIPESLRNKILLYCRDLFSNKRSDWSTGDYTQEFWNEIHEALLYRHGLFQLTNDDIPVTPAEDTIRFLLQCDDKQFLDFIEYIFKVRCLFHVNIEENTIVAELNELFLSENVGYELTYMVKEKVIEPVNEYPFFGREQEVIKTISYPQVIRKDCGVIHNMATKPSLQLLSAPMYKTANLEYMDALEDFRKGDYGDCLTKSCSAFESVMKIICEKNGWPYKQSDSASTLVNTVVSNMKLDSCFIQPLMIIATLRNRLSKSHGAGTNPKKVSQNLARYALNLTASAIMLLINEVE